MSMMGIEDEVVFTGFLADPVAAYHAIDLLAPPSEEVFSYVVIEAASCGVPCLRSRSGGAGAQIIDGVTG